jgi:alpha-beta hydrolase superfamily lysophospholipase
MSWLTEFNLDSTDKKSRLHVMEWLPDDMNIKAVLQISHGIAEHIGRYDTFARFMANNGFAVVGNSHLGHGQSAPEEKDRGFFADTDGWNTAVRDMHLVYEKEHAKYPKLPYFLLGHSMGSFLTRTFLIEYQNLLTGCVISGTGQQAALLLDVGLAAAGAEKLLFGARKPSARLNTLSFGAYNKRIPNHRTPSDWLTRDCDTVDKYIADDACGFVPTIGLFADMLGGIKFIGKKKNIAKMQKDLPILFISGEQDPVGDYGAGPKKVAGLFKDAGLNDITLKLYEGARHEVLNETNKQEVYQDVLDWITGKM